MMAGHTAIVTGANHGIGAATAVALARHGCGVLCTFLRVDDPDDPGTPQAHRDHRARDAEAVVTQIRAEGGQAVAVEADLADPATPALLFDAAEERLGPVDILVNNATGWLARPMSYGRPGSPTLRTTSAGDGVKAVRNHDAVRQLSALPDRAREEPRRDPARRRASSTVGIRHLIVVPWHDAGGPSRAGAVPRRIAAPAAPGLSIATSGEDP
jgi:NAD(P)-dependent dehydrogenase (short-subunit alcohol dehydrogenase family)